MKSGALVYGRTVDGEAKRISTLLAPIEEYLKIEEGKVTKEEARIKAAKAKKEADIAQARVDELRIYNVILPFREVELWTTFQYGIELERAKKNFEAEQARIAQEDKERQEKEAKLVADRAEIDRVAKIQEEKDKAQAKAEAKVKADREALEKEKREATESKARAEFKEKAKKEAATKAKKDAKEKVIQDALRKDKREAREAAEKQRQLDLAPDKEKLKLFASRITGIINAKPDVVSKEANEICAYIKGEIEFVCTEAMKKVEEL